MKDFKDEPLSFKVAYWTMFFLLVGIVVSLLLSFDPKVAGFLEWFLGEKEPQLVLATLILAAFTLVLVLETRRLGEADREPWLFIHTPMLQLNGQFTCAFKNCGKLPVIYKVNSFDLKVENIKQRTITHLNNGGEVYQGHEQIFTFANLNMDDFLPAFNTQQSIKPNSPLLAYFTITFKYSLQGRVWKTRTKQYALEFHPILAIKGTGTPNQTTIVNQIETKHFEIAGT